MLFNWKIKGGIKVLIAFLVVFSLIGFAEKEHREEVCNHIMVNIANQYDNYFIDDEDILALMSKSGEDVIIGKPFGKLKLKEIEERIKADKFISDAQIFKDLRGNIIVKAKLRRPLARIVQSDAPDAYIARDGTVLPVSQKFTSRVMLVSGKFTKKIIKNDPEDTAENDKIFRLIQFIDHDPFWKAQIAQIDIDRKGNIKLFPQVTKQYIDFGKAEKVEEKFKKLMIFYKEILPRKGWNAYNKVSLKYEGQVVAE